MDCRDAARRIRMAAHHLDRPQHCVGIEARHDDGTFIHAFGPLVRIPKDPVLWRQDLPLSIRSRLTSFLFGYGKTAPQKRRLEQMFSLAGFRRAVARGYSVVNMSFGSNLDGRRFRDVYAIDMATGERKLVTRRARLEQLGVGVHVRRDQRRAQLVRIGGVLVRPTAAQSPARQRLQALVRVLHRGRRRVRHHGRHHVHAGDLGARAVVADERRRAVRLRIGPDIPVALVGGRRAAAVAEPGMGIGGVAPHLIDDDALPVGR